MVTSIKVGDFPVATTTAGPDIYHTIQSSTNKSVPANTLLDRVAKSVTGRYRKVEEKTSTFTLRSGDEGGYFRVNSVSTVYAVIPNDSVVNFPIGTSFTFEQSGAGQLSFGTGPNVTLNKADGFDATTTYSVITALKTADNTWTITGDLAAAVTDWDISALSYSGQSLNVEAQAPTSFIIGAKSDGTVLMVADRDNDDVQQYNLSTGWDLSTATPGSVFSIAGQELNISQGFFKADGTKFWVVGTVADTVFEFDLSTGWDISTASHSGIGLDLSPYMGPFSGLTFSDDGLNLYIFAIPVSVDYSIIRLGLSVAWDITTASFISELDIGSIPNTSSIRIAISSTGRKMLIAKTAGPTIEQWVLGVPFDTTTLSYEGLLLDLSGETSTLATFVTNPTLDKIIASAKEPLSPFDSYLFKYEA